MGKLEEGIFFTGSVGNLTAYRMRGVDKIIIRKKGGPTKKEIKEGRNFARTRETNAEFGGRATASRWIMRMMTPLKALADYNIAGPLNRLTTAVQRADVTHSKGTRSVALSRYPGVLEGFSLNKQAMFDSVVRAPLSVTIDHETLTARISFPELVPSINFMPDRRHAYYSFIAVLGRIPDLHYTPEGYRPENGEHPQSTSPSDYTTPWHPAVGIFAGTTVEIKLPTPPAGSPFTLMVSVGIRYGAPTEMDKIRQVERAGSAKVLRVG